MTGALDTVRALEKADPDTLRGRVQLAALAWSTGGLDEAKAALQDALQLEPNDVEARLLLGELQIATNQIAAGKASFRDAIDRSDGPIAVADAFAGWLMLRGEEAEAQELADRLTADAGSPEALAAAGALETTVKRPDRALALAERAAKLGRTPGQTALLTGAAPRRATARATRTPPSPSICGVLRSDEAFFDARLRAAELCRAGEVRRGRPHAHRDVHRSHHRRQGDPAGDPLGAASTKRGDAARAARRLDDALADGKRGTDARLVLARAAVDDRRGDWREGAGPRRADPGARAPQRRSAELRRVRRRRSRIAISPRATKRLQAAVALFAGFGSVIDS